MLRLAASNAALESGLQDPLDDAILGVGTPDLAGVRKLAEIPFDFVRKRVSVVVDANGRTTPIAITCLYVVAAEITKRWFYRNGR